MKARRVMMAWGGVVLSVALLVAFGAARGFVPRTYASLSSIGWSDHGPFLAGLQDRQTFAEYSRLAAAPSYHLKMNIANDLDSVAANATVRFVQQPFAPVRSVDLVLLANLARGSTRIEEVFVDGVPADYEMLDDNTLLRVQLSHTVQPGEERLISVRYRLEGLHNAQAGFGGFGLRDGVLSLGYAYPALPSQNPWHARKPAVWGDITANPAAFYVAELEYPADAVLAAPGVVLRTSRKADRVSSLVALGPARDFVFSLSKEYRIWQRKADGTTIRLFARSADSASAASALDQAAAALSLFSAHFGPYPYRTFTLVASPLEALGLEFPGYIIIAPWLLGDGARVVSGMRTSAIMESTVIHEVAHQWFYGLVGNDQLEEPWIDEGLAQYATWLYYTDRSEPSGARDALSEFSGRWRRVNDEKIPIGRSVWTYTRRTYGPIIYGRAPLFLLALSERMGDVAFGAFLSAVSRDYRWGVVDSARLKQEAEAACGCCLDDLWRAWVDG